MKRFVERKFVIYVGKQTINAIFFEKGQPPKPFTSYTLESKDTQTFFKTGNLNKKYLDALVSAILSLVKVYE